jgi:hypothetical protein
MPISTDMIVRIAYADIASHMGFPRSIDHWQNKKEHERLWKVVPSDCAAILIENGGAVVLDGNCSNALSAPEGGIIHIYGNLASTLDVSGHSEIVIIGDVLSDATIQASGICHLFTGGSFLGVFNSSGSSKIWIESNFSGTVRTGHPSTEMYIGKDFRGSVMPGETASLLWLTVGGYASHASISAIADCGYTQFNASINRSDVAMGIYPANGHVRKSSGGNSFNRWCVRNSSET